MLIKISEESQIIRLLFRRQTGLLQPNYYWLKNWVLTSFVPLYDTILLYLARSRLHWHSWNIRYEISVAVRLHRLCYRGNDEAAMITLCQTQFRVISVRHTVYSASQHYRRISRRTLKCICTPLPRGLPSQANRQEKGCQKWLHEVWKCLETLEIDCK